MKRALTLVAVAAATFGSPSSSSAQVSIRVPFVQVETGGPGGTYVRAPFVRIYTGPRIVYGPPMYGPPPMYGAPPVIVPGFPPPPTIFAPGTAMPPSSSLRPQGVPQPPGPDTAPPAKPATPPPPAPLPSPDADSAPPAPVGTQQLMTLEQFSKAFQPKAGSYEVVVQNPLTGQPATVRFTLPSGNPTRVNVGRNSLEYQYTGRQFVRIEFDRDGATVISR